MVKGEEWLFERRIFITGCKTSCKRWSLPIFFIANWISLKKCFQFWNNYYNNHKDDRILFAQEIFLSIFRNILSWLKCTRETLSSDDFCTSIHRKILLYMHHVTYLFLQDFIFVRSYISLYNFNSLWNIPLFHLNPYITLVRDPA